MMYGPAALPFLRWARAQGAIARDGLGMLVEQAAEAYFVWMGVRPETSRCCPSCAESRAQAVTLATRARVSTPARLAGWPACWPSPCSRCSCSSCCASR